MFTQFHFGFYFCLENFAVSKPTGQTSTNGNAHASRSADGNINPYFGNSSCSQTDSGNNLVWEVLKFSFLSKANFLVVMIKPSLIIWMGKIYAAVRISAKF